MLRFGHTAAQIGGHVRFGNLVAASALAGVEAGHQPALQKIQRSAGADMAGDAEVVAAHGIGIGHQQRVDLLCQPVLGNGLFVHGRILLCCYSDPEKPYLYDKILEFRGDFLACGEILHRDKPTRTSPSGPDALPVILHCILHFSRKALLFAPKGGTILLLVPMRFCGRMRRKAAWRGQNGRDETACFDPGGSADGIRDTKLEMR